MSSKDAKENQRDRDAPTQLAKVNRFANLASALCVLDCTLLPVLTVALQFTGFASESKMHALHELGHRAALYFVLPVGGTAAVSNFLSHRRPGVSFFALLGLLAVYAANSHGNLVKRLPHAIRHHLHHGLAHRFVNIAGCALLIGSNYTSHKIAHASGGCCHHGHGSQHGRDH